MLAKITQSLIIFLFSQTFSSPSPKPRPFFPWSPLCQFPACGHGQSQFSQSQRIFPPFGGFGARQYPEPQQASAQPVLLISRVHHLPSHHHAGLQLAAGGLFGNIFSNKDSLFNQIFGQQQFGVAPYPVLSTTTTTDDTSDINVDIPTKPLNEDEDIVTLDEDHDAAPLKEAFEKHPNDSAKNVTANVADAKPLTEDEKTKSSIEKDTDNVKTESDLEGDNKPMISKPTVTEVSANSAKETEETKTFGNQTIDAAVTDLPTEEETYVDEPDIELF